MHISGDITQLTTRRYKRWNCRLNINSNEVQAEWDKFQ